MRMVFTYLRASVFKHNNYFLILPIIIKLFMLLFSHVKYVFRMAGETWGNLSSKGGFQNRLLVHSCHVQNPQKDWAATSSEAQGVSWVMQGSSLEKAFPTSEICLVCKEDVCIMEIFLKL